MNSLRKTKSLHNVDEIDSKKELNEQNMFMIEEFLKVNIQSESIKEIICYLKGLF